MQFTIINIANKMPKWVIDGCDEYLKRVNYGKYFCKIVEIKAYQNPNKPVLETMLLEANKIKKHIVDGSFVVALDEKGVRLSSVDFSHRLDGISLHYSNIVFIIGGANGIHPDLKKTANLVLQLSSFTYPHALVRVIILEQLYRAISILDNHPYHRK